MRYQAVNLDNHENIHGRRCYQLFAEFSTKEDAILFRDCYNYAHKRDERPSYCAIMDTEGEVFV